MDLHDKAKAHTEVEKVSILMDIDFELELIHRDEINVSYILKLLARLNDANEEDKEKHRKALIETIAGDVQLRSKRELIEKFVEENLPRITDSDDIPEEFERFWENERRKALLKMSNEENLNVERLEGVIGNFLFTERKPMRDDVIGMLNQRPKLKERSTIAERLTNKILNFVETFISGVAG